MSTIHPTSVIEPGAQIGDNVDIGPLCHVGAKVTIGSGSRLISHISIAGRTTIGSGNIIWPHASIGADPQDLKFAGEDSQLIVGNDNQIRELVTIHKGTVNGGGVTGIGNRNIFMAGAHVAHDCCLGNHIILANAVLLAGHVHIGDHVIISGASAIHHYVTVGVHAFIGGLTRIVHDVPPYMVVEGNPASVRSLNRIGLERNNIPAESIRHLRNAYRCLYRNGSENKEGPISGTMTEKIAQLEQSYDQDRYVDTLIDFLREMSGAKYGRYRESTRHDSRHRNSG